jgi:WD40 repeat protein
MSTLLTCPACNRNLRLKADLGSRKVRCPACQVIFTPAATNPTPDIPVLAVVDQGGLPAPNAITDTPAPPAPAPTRPRRPFSALRFPVLVRSDPAKHLHGRIQAEVDVEGLHLLANGGEPVHVPVGSEVRVAGRGQLAVTLDDRQVTLAIASWRLYPDRLARDVVAFLRGDRARLLQAHYVLPLSLYIPALLAVGVPIIGIAGAILIGGALGGALWGGIGGALVGACFALARLERWPEAIRVLVTLLLAITGYAGLLIASYVGGHLDWPFSSPQAANPGQITSKWQWQQFKFPGAPAEVQLPGVASRQTMGNLPAGMQVYLLEHKDIDTVFSITYGEIPVNDMAQFTQQQRFDNARQGMLANTPGSVLLGERDLKLNEFPGREVRLQAGMNGKMVARIYAVKRRFYILLFGSSQLPLDCPEAAKYFDSFLFTVEPVAPHPVPAATRFPGLLGYWSFDGDNPARDTSGLGGHGALRGRAQTGAGSRGTGIELQGGNDRFDFGATPRFELPTAAPFTAAAWFQTVQPQGTLFWMADPGTATYLAVGLDGGHLFCSLGTSRSRGPQEPRQRELRAERQVNDADWHHWAVRRTDDMLELFLDGRRLAQERHLLCAQDLPAPQRLLGGPADDAARGFGFNKARPFTGLLDEACIFGRGLTDEEIQALAGRMALEGVKPGAVPDPLPPLSVPAVPAALRNPVQAMQFAPDGKLLATAAMGGVELWDTASGQRSAQFDLPRGEVEALRFSGDGSVLAWLSGGRVYLADVTGRKAHPNSFLASDFALSPNGRALICVDDRGSLHRYAVATGKLEADWPAEPRPAQRVRYSPDGKLLVVGCKFGNCPLDFMDPLTAQRGESGLLNSQLYTLLEISADQSFVALAHEGHLRVVELGRPDPRLDVFLQGQFFVAAAFAPGRKSLAALDSAGFLSVWDLATGRQRAVLVGKMPDQAHRRHQSLSFSPDGRILAAAIGGELRFWDVTYAVGPATPTIPPRPLPWKPATLESAPAFASAYSPDGKVVATASPAGLTVWNAALGTSRTTLTTPPGALHCLTFSRDGKVLICGAGNMVRVWDVAMGPDGSPRFQQREADLAAVGCALSPAGQLLAARSTQDSAEIYNLQTRQKLLPPNDVAPLGRDMQFSPDGRTLALSQRIDLPRGRGRSTLILWDIEGHEVRYVLPADGGSERAVVFSPNGKLVACLGRQVVQVFDTVTGRPVNTFSAQGAPIVTMAFAPDNSTLAIANRLGAGEVVLTDVLTAKVKARFPCQQPAEGPGNPADMTFAPDGQTLLVTTTGRVQKLDTSAGVEKQPIRLPAPVSVPWPTTSAALPRFALQEKARLPVRTRLAKAVSPDGNILALADLPDQVSFWGLPSGKPGDHLGGIAEEWLKKAPGLPPGESSVHALRYSPDGKRLAVGTRFGSIELWDLVEKKRIWAFNPPQLGSPIGDLAFATDGKTLASATIEGAIQVWDLPAGKEITLLKDQDPQVGSVLLTPDGKTAITSNFKRKVVVWDVATGKPRSRLEGHDHYIDSFALTSDGKTLATGGLDNTIHLWDLETARELRVLRGHRQAIFGLTFSADGRTLVSIGRDLSVRRWDVTTGKQVAQASYPYTNEPRIAFAPGGQVLVADGADGKVIIWQLGDKTERK